MQHIFKIYAGIVLAAAIVGAVVLLGPWRQTPEPPAPVPTPPPLQDVGSPEPEPPAVPAGTNPMTGLPMEPEHEELRPAAVVFNNLKAAQPQLGISGADVIYEVPAEGGVTRMLALFQTLEGVGDLGSIRSARPYYIELALGHEALFVHAGGSPEAYRDLRAWQVDAIDGVNGRGQEEVFWRDGTRRRTMGLEHSLLTSGTRIDTYWKEKTSYRQARTGTGFAPAFSQEAPDGAAAQQITVRLSSGKETHFRYDAQKGLYLVSQYGQPYTDGTDGVQLSAANVLVLETAITVLDAVGRLKVVTTGAGEGTLYRSGVAVPLRWSRNQRTDPLTFTTPEGEPLALAPGRSYICILDPRNGGASLT